MKNKKISVFYIFLTILIIAVIALVEYGKPILREYLKEYEDSQYKYVAEDFLEDNFNSGDFKTVSELFASQISKYERKENINKFFTQLFSKKAFSLQSISTGLDGNIQYIIKDSENLKYATLHIAKSDEKSAHNFDLYEPSKLVLNKKLLNSYSIDIPLGYSLTVNGIPADESNCNKNEFFAEFAYLPEDIEGIKYTTYSFENMCYPPEFEVLDSYGATAEVTKKEDNLFVADIVYSAALENEYSQYVIEATKAYACYLQKDATIGQVKPYMDASSKLYNNIRTSPNWMVIDHTGYAFENEKASEFIAYSDDVFSCRVTLTHILKYPRLEDYRDSIDITWYLHKVNGKYLIYDSYTR